MYGPAPKTGMLTSDIHAVEWMERAYTGAKVGVLDAEIEKIRVGSSPEGVFKQRVMPQLLRTGLSENEVASVGDSYSIVLKKINENVQAYGTSTDVRVDVSVGRNGVLVVYHTPKGTNATRLARDLRDSSLAEDPLSDFAVYSGDDGTKVCVVKKYADPIVVEGSASEGGLALAKRVYEKTGDIPTMDNLRTYLDLHGLTGKGREKTALAILEGFQRWQQEVTDKKVAIGFYLASSRLERDLNEDGEIVLSEESRVALETPWQKHGYEDTGNMQGNNNVITHNVNVGDIIGITDPKSKPLDSPTIKTELRDAVAQDKVIVLNHNLMTQGAVSTDLVKRAMAAGILKPEDVPAAVYSYFDQLGNRHGNNPFHQKSDRANN